MIINDTDHVNKFSKNINWLNKVGCNWILDTAERDALLLVNPVLKKFKFKFLLFFKLKFQILHKLSFKFECIVPFL